MDKNFKIHRGVITLNDGKYEIPCYVIDNGTSVERVLTQREVVKLITGGRESGHLKQYLSSRALETALPSEISTNFDDNVLNINMGTYSINGIKASIVVDICNAYLKARQLGILAPNQMKLAEQSEIFISALAKTGIDAIIDEATGYQYFRKANDLQAKLDAYIVEGYREWTRTFPREFFMHLYRLEGRPIPMIDQPYPKRFGKYVMQYVYDTLDKEVADYLRENNPEPSGKKHHHQKLSDFGYKALTDHLFSVLGIAKASINMDKFKENLAFAFPNARTNKIIRMVDNKKKNQVDTKYVQRTLFDILPTADNGKQFENDFLNEPEVLNEENKLSSFDKSLKKALDYNSKNNQP